MGKTKRSAEHLVDCAHKSARIERRAAPMAEKAKTVEETAKGVTSTVAGGVAAGIAAVEAVDVQRVDQFICCANPLCVQTIGFDFPSCIGGASRVHAAPLLRGEECDAVCLFATQS